MTEIAGIKPAEVRPLQASKAPEQAKPREQGRQAQEAAVELKKQRANGKATKVILRDFVTADAFGAMQQEARAVGVGVGKVMENATKEAGQKLTQPLRVEMSPEQAEKFFADLAEAMRKQREKGDPPPKVLAGFADGLI